MSMEEEEMDSHSSSPEYRVHASLDDFCFTKRKFSGRIELCNPYDIPFHYSVQTTKPEYFSVYDGKGVIEPKHYVLIDFRLKKRTSSVEDSKVKIFISSESHGISTSMVFRPRFTLQEETTTLPTNTDEKKKDSFVFDILPYILLGWIIVIITSLLLHWPLGQSTTCFTSGVSVVIIGNEFRERRKSEKKMKEE